MGNRKYNRLKVVLVEKGLSNKWLAKKLDKSETTISNWCTNIRQPSIPTLFEIADVLDVDTKNLLYSNKN